MLVHNRKTSRPSYLPAAPKASNKRSKDTPKGIKTISVKIMFAILSLRKPGSRSPKRQHFDLEIDKNNDLETSPNKLEFQASELKATIKKHFKLTSK